MNKRKREINEINLANRLNGTDQLKIQIAGNFN